jgi:hypothetical protein
MASSFVCAVTTVETTHRLYPRGQSPPGQSRSRRSAAPAGAKYVAVIVASVPPSFFASITWPGAGTSTNAEPAG